VRPLQRIQRLFAEHAADALESLEVRLARHFTDLIV
jgi:hypothetical protein